jgi:Mrp family chromosome partitioning ATPase
VEALRERDGARASPARPADRDGGVLRALITGAGIGLLAGLLLALVREALDVRRTSSRTVGARLAAKELGQVPGAPAAVEHAYRVEALEDPEGAVAAAYRLAAASVAEEAERASARVVMVAGTVAEDHGEQVAANLAVSLAAGGRRVALVEIDPGRPLLRRLFALERGAGLGEVLRDEVPLEAALVRVAGVESLVVLTVGTSAPVAPPPDALLDALAGMFELVVVCAPPLLRRGRVRLPRADGLLLAVHLHRIRHSRRPRLERLLRRLDVPVLGFVLVGAGDRTALPKSPERVAPD